MILLHVNRRLTAYIHGELTPRQAEKVERHLAACPRCREEAHRLRAVHSALPALTVQPAPETLWRRIEQELDRQHADDAAENKNGYNPPSVTSTHSAARDREGKARYAVALASLLVLLAAGGLGRWALLRQRGPSWEVRRLQGRPLIGWFPVSGTARLRPGDRLTTDSNSRAEIAVANIGTVTIAPGSRVRLAATGNRQHRLALEVGSLEAKVIAPPRLFVVDTQSGRAVDLGCAYRLAADDNGTTTLHVTLGQVSLEDAGRASLVPKGFSCESRRGAGLGTPVNDEASEPFRQAVHRFDFEAGGIDAAEQVRRLARPEDALTLWHLLRRTPETERGAVYDTLARLSRPPGLVSRAGVIRGDSAMLDVWKEAILYDLP